MKEENIHKLLKDFIFFFSYSPHPSDFSERYPPLRSLSQSLHHPLVSPFSLHPSDLSGRYPLCALYPSLSISPSYRHSLRIPATSAGGLSSAPSLPLKEFYLILPIFTKLLR